MKFLSMIVVIVLMLVNPVRALAQPSAWANLQTLADTMGTFGIVIDATLSTNEQFVLYVEPTDDIVVYCVGEIFCTYGVTAVTEDANGTFSIPWLDGAYVMTVACTNQAGGIAVTLEGPQSTDAFVLDSDGVIATDSLALSAETAGGTFWCGTQCPSGWVRVKKCLTGQTCCGYYYCGSGVSQATCCNSGTHCNWDGVGRPPAIQCVANP